MNSPSLHLRRRKLAQGVIFSLCGLATAGVISLLLFILGYTLANGLGALNLDLLTQGPRPLGEAGGGMRPEILGTAILVALAIALGLPPGLLIGVYLAEYGGRPAHAVRFVADVLTGVPSIIVGVFAYTLVVRPLGHFSALSGAVALAIIMLPVIARTSEEALRLVPRSIREAALALGIPRWRTTLRIVLPGARTAIITGALLAVARIAGETAPLIFTAFGNRFGFAGPLEPIAALPLQVWRYAISPYEEWHRQAWAASLLLVALILFISIAVRLLARRGRPR